MAAIVLDRAEVESFANLLPGWIAMSSRWMNEIDWSEYRLWLTRAAMEGAVVLAIGFGGKATARWLGYPGDVGFNVAMGVYFVGLMAWFFRREYPRQGRPLLYRMLAGVGLIFGLGFILISAAYIQYDEWFVFFCSVRILAVILLVVLFARVCSRYSPTPAKSLKGPMGDWSV